MAARNNGRSRSRASNRGNSRRGSRRGDGTNTGWLYVAGAIVALGFLGFAFWWSNQDSTAKAVDETTLCPVATGPVGQTVILLDLTDPLSPAQHAQLMTWLEKEIDDAPQGTQFTLGVVSDDPTQWGATDPLCKPQTAESASSLTQNARIVEERYQQKFLQPLTENLTMMVRSSGANRSPIMESLQALVSDTPGFITSNLPRRIVMVSDLLQHSDALSFYRGGDWESFRRSPAYQRIGAALVDTDIRIYQVPRPTEGVKDPAVLEDFWIRYFEVQGAHLPRVTRLGDL